MQINMKVEKTSGSFPDSLVEVSEILSLYRSGALELSETTARDFQETVIEPLKSKVASYCMEFDMASNSYLKNNSTLAKMKNAIMSPSSTNRGQKIDSVSNRALNNKKRTTQQMIKTMEKGHSLLLEIREAFTGSSIDTKFTIQVDGRTFVIDEKYLKPELVLSAFGGGTVSNPFSLAYKIDRDLLKSKEFLENAEEITDVDVWQKIFSLKPEYLSKYKTPITGKIYSHYYFDSKDAEIYESFIQNKENILSLTVAKYAQMRADMGGGGGYASPFYKTGDVGSVQVKFFNLKQGEKSSTVNFARFSLLRDRFRQLYDILSYDTPLEMGKALQKFFTEEESRTAEGITREINRETQQIFNRIFQL